MKSLKIAWIGSSLVSAYWNGAATYYRGIIKALYKLDYDVTFFEPDAFERQQNRDIPDPEYARVVIWPATSDGVKSVIAQLPHFDIVIKASGVGVFDPELEVGVLEACTADQKVIFWDVDAPATLASMQNPENPFTKLVPEFDLILTYGGGDPVVEKYSSFNAKRCIPIYNALDPETHFPVDKQEKFKCDLAFLGNRLPDREQRVEEFFLDAALFAPKKSFILGGSGWEYKALVDNIKYIGHVYTHEHNAFNCSPKAVLNISRESMAQMGFSPATRVFEAAGAGACLITDFWQGIEYFFEPEQEILVAHSGEEVAQIVNNLKEEQARYIGQNALKRVLQEHTYEQRAQKINQIFHEA